MTDHIFHAVEALLAICGAMKFAHEVFEMLHHLSKLKAVVQLLKR